MPKRKTFFNWSTGKDAALALHYLLEDSEYSVEYLLTTINAHYNRVTMHGLRAEFLQQQLQAIGTPGGVVGLPANPANDTYEQRMGEKIQQLRKDGFEYAAFGDIFLEDLKQYREAQLLPLHVKPLFPLWKKDTRYLIQEFIDLGFKAVVVCGNAALLDESFAGREIDEDFIRDLPDNVDPCGENGEFHTFCYDAPYFHQPIPFTLGETVLKEYQHGEVKTGFWFRDLLPQVIHDRTGQI
ncbi:MAG: ATP-binding protein [Bacteroidota bacterium]